MGGELKLNFQSKVYIVGCGRIERQGILEALLEVGFAKPQVFVDAEGVFEFMGKGNTPDWIFVSDLGDSFENAKNVAKILLLDPSLSRVGLSVVADPKFRDRILEMFSLGAMTFVSSPISKASFKSEIRNLVTDMPSLYPNSCTLAVSQLIRLLEKYAMHKESEEVLKAATLAYPWDQELLILRARSEAKLAKFEESALTFELAAHLNPSKRKKIDERIRAAENMFGCQIDVPSLTEVLGLDFAMIISNDETRRSRLVEGLESAGLCNAICCRTGIEAWGQILDGFRPDILFIDGTAEFPSASAIFERFHASGLREVALVVVGDLDERADRVLLEESNAIFIDEKQLSTSGLRNMLLANLKTTLLPNGYNRKVAKLEASLLDSKYEIARNILDDLRNNINLKEGLLAYAEAVYALHCNQNEAAKEGLAAAIEKEPDNSRLIGLMGEALLNLGQPDVAKMMILRSLKQTPKSVRKFCDLANAYIGLGEFEKAKKILDSAEKIDKGYLGIKALRAFLATLEKDHKLARTLLTDRFVREQYVGLINRRARASIDRKELSGAIELFRRSICDIGDAKHKGLASLWMNQGLACLNASELEEGVLALEKATQFGGASIAKTAKAILHKIELAEKKGRNYVPRMSAGDQNFALDADSGVEDIFGAQRKIKSKLRPGERGCFKIFEISAERDDEKLAG